MKTSPLKSLPTLEFLCALTVAAVADSLQKLVGIYRALRSKGHVSEEIAGLRMEICKQCPVFYAPLRTCGSPLPGGARDIENGQHMGCFCHCPHISKAEHNCFLYDRDKGETILGWPASINSFPYEQQRDHQD